MDYDPFIIFYFAFWVLFTIFMFWIKMFATSTRILIASMGLVVCPFIFFTYIILTKKCEGANFDPMPPRIEKAVKADEKKSKYADKKRNLQPEKRYQREEPGKTKGPFKNPDKKKGRLGTVQKRGQSGICINSPLCEASKSYMFNGDLSGQTKIIQPYVNNSVAHYYDDTLDDPFTFDLSNDSYVIGPPLDIPMGAFIQCKDKNNQYYVYQGDNRIRQAYYAYLESSANALYDEVSDCSQFTVTNESILDLPVGSFVKCGTAPINGLPGPNNINPKQGAIQHNNKYSWKSAIYKYQGRDSNNRPLIRWIPNSDIGASLTYNALTNSYSEKSYNDKPIIIDCQYAGFYRDSIPSDSLTFSIAKDVKLDYDNNTIVSCKAAPYKDQGEKTDLSGIYDINSNIYLFNKESKNYDSSKIKKYIEVPGTLSWFPTKDIFLNWSNNSAELIDKWDNPIVLDCNLNRIPRDLNNVRLRDGSLLKSSNGKVWNSNKQLVDSNLWFYVDSTFSSTNILRIFPNILIAKYHGFTADPQQFDFSNNYISFNSVANSIFTIPQFYPFRDKNGNEYVYYDTTTFSEINHLKDGIKPKIRQTDSANVNYFANKCNNSHLNFRNIKTFQYDDDKIIKDTVPPTESQGFYDNYYRYSQTKSNIIFTFKNNPRRFCYLVNAVSESDARNQYYEASDALNEILNHYIFNRGEFITVNTIGAITTSDGKNKPTGIQPYVYSCRFIADVMFKVELDQIDSSEGWVKRDVLQIVNIWYRHRNQENYEHTYIACLLPNINSFDGKKDVVRIDNTVGSP